MDSLARIAEIQETGANAKMASRQPHLRLTFAALAALALAGGCHWPTWDQSKLKAVRAESHALIAAYPTETGAGVPKSRCPGTIASLEPEMVTVYPDGVVIMTEPDFDGGWGYFVPASDREPPELAGRYWKVADGVYWYGPH
jgi:hypothetical protein